MWTANGTDDDGEYLYRDVQLNLTFALQITAAPMVDVFPYSTTVTVVSVNLNTRLVQVQSAPRIQDRSASKIPPTRVYLVESSQRVEVDCALRTSLCPFSVQRIITVINTKSVRMVNVQ